jgi:hypothetical protein
VALVRVDAQQPKGDVLRPLAERVARPRELRGLPAALGLEGQRDDGGGDVLVGRGEAREQRQLEALLALAHLLAQPQRGRQRVRGRQDP